MTARHRFPPPAGDNGHDQSLIAIVEPDGSGHRLAYVRHLVDNPPPRTRVIALVNDHASITPYVDLHLAGMSDANLWRCDLSTWRRIRKVVSELAPDTCVFPDGDRYISHAVLQPMSCRITRFLLLRDPFASFGRGGVRGLAKRGLLRLAALRSNTDIAILTPGFGGSRPARFRSVPDPVTIAPAERAFVDHLDPNRVWFAILGYISSRKNASLLADIVCNTSAFERRVGLVVAGQFSAEEREALEKVRATARDVDALVLRDQLLSDDEMDAAVERSHCLIVAHSNEGPSGLLGKAAAAGTQVLTSGALSLRHDTTQLPGLATWVPLERDALREAIFSIASTDSEKRPVRVAAPHSFASALLDVDPQPCG